jgi:hypothetical protein
MAAGFDSAAMNDARARPAVIAGLTLAVVIAAWWLGATLIVLEQAADASGAAARALHALMLVRAMALAVLGLRLGALQGWRPAVTAGLGLIAPAWPLVLAIGSASEVPFPHLVLGESLLVAASLVLPWLGLALRRWLRAPELAVMTATAAGIALAAFGFAHDSMLLPPS